ncbi:TonB-dependent receptor [Dyadobacter psychrotolerans]|uniref:TonB-dependent receptor n=2 Tax=Dyadobacter psychrotolerans TaxID=2541721 RepID=A0A4R5DCD9_9BACT|nr:TonB-dependent receptor [Dyadobacter psychrotolerans]
MKKRLLMFLKKPGITLAFMMVLLSYTSGFAQTVKVEGIVKDAQGVLPGVSIVAKGTSTGTISDGNGAYKLDVSGDAVLIYTFIGYEAKEVSVKSVQPVNGVYKIEVNLANQINNLDEVVVVGFGTQKKVNLTGAVATVDAKAIENRPVRNATQALQGLVTGLNISQNNGSLETNPSINIRGTGTIGNSSSSPLIMVDGMEGSLNAINPQDIESISVLKDAAAAAVYGSRAAFGVILITTKRGKSGKLQLNYNNSFRSTAPVLMPKMMDSYTFALFFNDAGTNGGSAPHFSAEHLQRIKDYQDGKITASVIPSPSNTPTNQVWGDGYAYGNANVDWYKEMFRSKTLSQEHNFSLSGGNEKTQVYISGNYMGQQGLMRFNQDDFTRYGFTAKINSQLSEAVSVNYSTRFLREDYNRPSQLTNGFYDNLGRQGWPTLPLYDPNGNLFSSPSPALGMRDGGKDRSQKDYLYQQLQLVFEPIKGWKTFTEINYRTRNDFRHWDTQRTYNYDINNNPILYGRNSDVYEYGYKENYFNSNIYSEYSKTLAQKHFFKIMGGFQTELTKYRDLSATRNGIMVAELPTIATTNGTDGLGLIVAPGVTGVYQRWATAGFFGRLNYDYDGKYLIEANLRYDGSSRYRAEQRWNLFPSVSVGWNMAREKFWEDNISFINTMKLRASYGQLGNQKPADGSADFYPTYVTQPVGTATGSWLIANARPNTAGAPGLVASTLTWETIKSYDIGLDWGLFNNRLTGSADWFLRKTINMVGPAPTLPVILGTAVPQINNTDLKTSGFELEIAWNDRLKNGLGYNLRFLLSDYQTTITRYPNPTGDLGTYRAGQKLGDIWGYQTIGIAKSQEEMNTHLASLPNGGQTALGSQWAAGDIMYADLNGDGQITQGATTLANPGDRSLIGNSTPRYTIGADINLDWKGFDFRGFLQGVLKRDIWQGSYFFWGATSNMWFSTGLVEHEDYFRADANHPLGQNLDSYYPRPNFRDGKNQQTQTRYLQDASYIRLKNIQLGYTIPANITKKFAVQKLRFYLSGENVFTKTKMAKMFDPETVDGGSGGSVYPLSKVYAAGLSLTF